MFRRLPRLLPLPLPLLLVAACSAPGTQPDATRAVDGAQLADNQLRSLVFSFGRYFREEVERAADAIAAQTDDPRVRRDALRWKINTVSRTQTAAMRVNPVMSFLDSWVLAVQMRAFFEEGRTFGELQPVALEATLRVEREARRLAEYAADAPTIADLEQQIAAWLPEHRLSDLTFSRWGEASSVFLSFLADSELDALTAVASAEDRATHIAMILPELTDALTKKAAWQAELLALDLIEEQRTSGLLRDVATLAAVAEQVPEMRASMVREVVRAIDDQRAALVEMVVLQREELTTALDTQRAAIQGAVHAERLAFEAHLADQRVAALAEIDAQRMQTLELIEERRLSTLDDLRNVVEETLEAAPQRVEGTVDAFWVRAVQFAVVAFVVGGGLAFLAARHLVDRARRSG